MFIVYAFGALFTMGVVIAVGQLIAQSQNPPSVTPGNNDSSQDCAQLCLQFSQRRAEKCMAQAAIAPAQARVNALNLLKDDAYKTWLLASAAAIAASFIPFLAPVFIAILVTVAATAFTSFLLLVGAVNGASADLTAKTTIAATALNKETEARMLLLTKCPETANACLSTPSPC